MAGIQGQRPVEASRSAAGIMSAPLDLLAPGEPVDATNCHREPIHAPGAIQPHGVLLAARGSGAGAVVEQASANAAELFALPFEQVLGSSLADLLGSALADELARRADAVEAPSLRPRRVRIGGRSVDAFAHRPDAATLVIELETVEEGAGATLETFQEDVAQALGAVQGAADVAALVHAAAVVVRRLTGFDRVWVYRFEPDDHGVIVAEEQDGQLPPFLGLHYPAADIPPQARALFLESRLRLIPDVAAEPVAVLPLVSPATGAWLDLSGGVLRAVSPVHLRYLRSMRATASMSIALTVRGRLWGLISAHHYAGPRHASHQVRAACEFVGLVCSMQLASFEELETGRRRHALGQHRRRLLEALDDAPTFAQGLASVPADLLDVCGADGVAVRIGGELELRGETPSPAAVLRLVEALRERGDVDVVASDSLAAELPRLAALGAHASGVLAAPLSRAQGNYVIWFRREWVHSVAWGHEQPPPAADGSPALGPHGSFERWSQSVQGTSRPWQAVELESATALRAALGMRVLRRAEQLAELNAALSRSNAELDAFAHVVAHDLKEPLRGIDHYAAFLTEDYHDALDEPGREQLATLTRLVRRMDGLLDSLLEYAQIGHLELRLEDVTLGELVADARELAHARLAEPGVELALHDAAQPFRADRERVAHLLVNLVSNAVKYNDQAVRHVAIDVCRLSETRRGRAAAQLDADPAHDPFAIRVRDDGIGIAPQDRDAVFRVFRRLHAPEAHGGGHGAGLTIARRIAERHGGMLWLDDSTPGFGSCFCFTLEPAR